MLCHNKIYRNFCIADHPPHKQISDVVSHIPLLQVSSGWAPIFQYFQWGVYRLPIFIYVIIYCDNSMKRVQDIKYSRFVEHICERKLPVTFEPSMLQKMYKICCESGVQCESFNECIKQLPGKVKGPLKTAVTKWLEKQQAQSVYAPLRKFLAEIEVVEKQIVDIWRAFRNKNINEAKKILDNHMEYFKDGEKNQYQRQIEDIYQQYCYENQTNFYAKEQETVTPKTLQVGRSSTVSKNTTAVIFNTPKPKPFQFQKGRGLTPNKTISPYRNLNEPANNLNKTTNQFPSRKVPSKMWENDQEQGKSESGVQVKISSGQPIKQMNVSKNLSSIKYTTVFDYFMSKFEAKNLWEIDQPEQKKLKDQMTKSPQLFEILIQKFFGKGKIYGSVIKEAKQDEKFQRLLTNSLHYPLHKLFCEMQVKSRKEGLLYCEKIKIKSWQIKQILAQTTKVFQGLMVKLINQEEQNMENIMISMADLVFDVLTRKGNLSMKITEINKIATEKSHTVLKEITLNDFLVLFTRIVDKQRMAHFGYLLHKNQLPIPLIACTVSKRVKVYYPEMSLIQDILLDKKTKMICSMGTAMTEKKGKTELLTAMLGIQSKNSSTMYCQFHKGCLSLYTNLQAMTGQEAVMVADLHGNIDDYKESDAMKKVVDNSCLIIVHIHEKEEEKLQEIIKGLLNKDSRLIVLVRDSELLKVKNQINFQKIYIPSLKSVTNSGKQIIYCKLMKDITNALGESQNYVDYKNLTEGRERQKLSEQEKLENSILRQMQSYPMNELWDKCFYNICLYRETHQMELNMLELQRIIIYDKKDERNIQFLEIKQALQQKQKDEKQKNHSLAKVANTYFEKFDKINIRSLNCKIADWKKTSTDSLELSLVDLRAKLEKKIGKQKQTQALIIEKEKQLKQFDISIDTLIQQITIVANYNNEYEKYEKCVKNYYNQLYKSMNPINLIDGNTLLFGNAFLMSFIEDISKQIPKWKKIYVVSVIGIQSSAKSTLMNYLFNCRFETSAGRCTKGAYFTISQTENQAFIVVDTEGLMSVSARDRVFDIQIASFTFLISDIVIINNKGEINAPIRELLGVCTYALKELNQRKSGKERSKVFFAIRDQSSSGVHTQKSMLSDIIRELKTNADLADFEQFLDFTSEEIYPMQSAFNQEATALDTKVEKSNYCFSESIMALRSKIIEYLRGKQPEFESLENFYQGSRQIWDAIRRCGQHIFNFQQVLQIRIKQDLKQFQKELLETQSSQIALMVQQSINDIEKINNNDQLKNYKEKIMGHIEKSSILVRDQIKSRGEKMKGVKSDWINDLIEDSKRQFNDKVIIHIEFIDNLYKEKIKRNKGKNFQQQISQITSSIIKTDKSLESIRSQYKKQCSKLLGQEEYKFDDNQLFLKGVLEKQVQLLTRIKINVNTYREFSSAKDHLTKFDLFFITTFLKACKKSFGVDSQEKVSFAKLVQEKYQILLKDLARLNNKFLPITGQNNKKFIVEFKLKIDEMAEIIKSDIQRMTKEWKASQIKLNEEKFRVFCFCLFCKKVPALIFKNRQIVQEKAQKEKEQLIKKKWEEIQKSFKIKGDSSKVTDEMIRQFEKAMLDELYEEAKKSMLNSLVTLISKFSPVKMIQQAMRLTFKSSQSGQATWIKCFKAIYNINVFLQQEILDKQSQFLELKNNINIQKENTSKIIPEKLESVRIKLQSINKFELIGQVLGIDIKIFQYEENVKNFPALLTQLNKKFKEPNLSTIRQNIRTSVFTEEGKFDGLQEELNKYVDQNIKPKIIGCQARCPICSMKCKLSSNHEEGHKCVEGSHLQSCFAGISNIKTDERSQNMCFTEEHIKNVGYFSGQSMIPTLEHIEQKYPEWLDHFKQGPYQDKVNELTCERIWANIGDVLIQTKFKNRNIKNNNVVKKYESNPLKFEDIKDWVEKHEKQNQDELEMLNSLLILLKLASLFG